MADASNRILKFGAVFLFLFAGIWALGQTRPGSNKEPEKRIKHHHSDVLSSKPDKFEGNPFAYGSVLFEHDGTMLYSDSAVYYQNEDIFRAWGNVRVINDTVSMHSDSLEYSSATRMAKGFKNVRLKDRQSELFADYVEYNRITDIAAAKGNVVIVDPSQRIETPHITYNRTTGVAHTDAGAHITGEDGTRTFTRELTYNSNTKSIDFNEDTTIETPDYRIRSVKMVMNQETDVTEFIGKSTVTDKKNPRNYIDMPNGGGVFNKKTGIADLNKRSVVHRDGKELHADRMHFNDKTGYGWARGDILIDDPEEKRFIRGEFAEVFRDIDSAYVTGRAYAVKAFERDSLYFHADTIMAVQRSDEARIIKAYFNGRFYKTDIQGKSDSIFYNETKGLLEMFRDPIIWSGEQQITGDTINLFNNPVKEVMDSVWIFNHAFAISKVDSLKANEFNQVKGRFMSGYFLNNELKFVEVTGNAQSITFVDSEEEDQPKERIGINLSDCGIIEAEIEGEDVEVLACLIQANSNLYPESKLPTELWFLKDFHWRSSEKMKRWQDIFGDPPDGENQEE